MPRSGCPFSSQIFVCRYLHACLKYVQRDYLTNSSLRKRFDVAERNKSSISRYIKEAVDAGAILPFDQQAARRLMKYVPNWAGNELQLMGS